MSMMSASRDRKIVHKVGRYSIPIVLLILWESIFLIVGQPAMASPLQSVSNLAASFSDWLPDIGATLLALLISFAIAALFGIILGFFIGLSSFWTQVSSPILLVLYSIPKVTLYPVFLLIFGLTLQGRVAFSVFHGIFPILIICMEATRTIPNIYLKVGDSYQMSFLQKVRHILIPSIMPQLVVGLRTGFNLCFLGLILAEMFASYQGIGTRLIQYTSQNNPSAIFALILIVVFIALFFTFLFLLWQEKNELKIGKTKSLSP